MNCGSTTTRLKKIPGIVRRRMRAFTLIEMLLVITIIALLATLGLPHLKGWGESNSMTAATRQLMDDLSYARLRAINGRSTVYVVFIPPDIVNPGFLKPVHGKDGTNLFSGQYTTYAVFTKRQVGEQPGRDNPRYLTQWKSLPDKVFIATNKYVWPQGSRFDVAKYSDANRPFATNDFPFPTATNATVYLPYIAFNSKGQLISEDDVDTSGGHHYYGAAIPLARGSIFYERDRDGNLIAVPADVIETPPQNSITNYNRVHIDWLTGRTRVERKEFQ